MIRRNEEVKLTFSARIKVEGKEKGLHREEIESFLEKLENFSSNPVKQSDALHLLVCLQVGRLVEVEENEIRLHYWTRLYRPMMIISENPELVSLLKELVRS